MGGFFQSKPFEAAANALWVGQSAYDVASGERSFGDAVGDVVGGIPGYIMGSRLGSRLTKNMKPGMLKSTLGIATGMGGAMAGSMAGSYAFGKIMPWQRQPKEFQTNYGNPGDFAQPYQTYPE